MGADRVQRQIEIGLLPASALDAGVAFMALHLEAARALRGAALDVTLTDDEVTALEEHYTPRKPTYYGSPNGY